MVIQHRHQPGSFDPGHCRGCAHQADLLWHRTLAWQRVSPLVRPAGGRHRAAAAQQPCGSANQCKLGHFS
jgi:hypothetical protein